MREKTNEGKTYFFIFLFLTDLRFFVQNKSHMYFVITAYRKVK